MNKPNRIHKRLDWIAKQHPINPDVYKIYDRTTYALICQVPKELIEDSNDWEVEKQPIDELIDDLRVEISAWNSVCTDSDLMAELPPPGYGYLEKIKQHIIEFAKNYNK